MKIMIVGIGGVGGYIAGMVGQKYKNLTLIARGKRGEALREHGVVLHSDFHGEKIVKDGVIRECAREVEEIQDLIFLCVKTYALEDVCQTLGSCVDDHTIYCSGNEWGGYSPESEGVSGERTCGGCSDLHDCRRKRGLLYHTARTVHQNSTGSCAGRGT